MPGPRSVLIDKAIVIVIGSILLVAVADLVLAAKWNRAYFLLGIPIFARRIERPEGIGDLNLSELSRSTATAGGAPLLFHRLSPDVVLFRDQIFGGTIHYIPIMRGVIRYDAAEGVVRVRGLLNWFALVFVASFAVLMGSDFVELLPYICGVFGVIYLIQAVRYNRVAKQLRLNATAETR